MKKLKSVGVLDEELVKALMAFEIKKKQYAEKTGFTYWKDTCDEKIKLYSNILQNG